VTFRSPVKTVGSALTNHWHVMVGIVLLCLLVAAAAIVIRRPTYEATATLLVDERQSSSQGFDLALQASQVLGQQYIDMIGSWALLTQACGEVPTSVACEPNNLAQHVNTAAVKGTRMIAVTVSARSPADAAALANAIAGEAVIENRAQAADLMKPTREYLTAELAQLSGRIAAEQTAIAAISTGVPDAQGSRQLAPHTATLSLLQAQYSDIYGRLQDERVQEARLGSDLSVVQQARAPDRPSDPDPLRYILVALAGGLFIGLLAALIFEHFDSRLRRGNGLAEAAGVTLVIDEPGGGHIQDDLRSRTYALCRASLLSKYPDARRIAIVAASTGDSAASPAASLAAAAASFGQHVLLIAYEANGRRRRGRRRLKSGSGSITVIDSSGAPVAAGIDSAGGPYDLTLLSLPSPTSSPAAVLLAPDVDLVVLVATTGRTSFEEAQRAAEILRRSGSEIAAGVMVNSRRRDLQLANGNSASH
jgi:capsular polysaccharide biosynthesis protein